MIKLFVKKKCYSFCCLLPCLETFYNVYMVSVSLILLFGSNTSSLKSMESLGVIIINWGMTYEHENMHTNYIFTHAQFSSHHILQNY